MQLRLSSQQKGEPNKFEMIFSYAIISIMAALGFLILAGAFGINPEYRVILALILIAYSLIRFVMLRSRYGGRKRNQDGTEELPKEEGESLRKV